MWFGLNGVHKIRKLMRILDKKDRRVITDEIENSLFGIKFGRKTADITYGISRPRAALYCRKANKDRGNFLWIAQKRGFRDVAQVFIWLEIAVRCRSAGVNDPLRDTLMVKVGNFLAQDKIFQQRRATAAGAKRILIVGDAHALIGGQRIIFAAFTKGVEGSELIIRGLGRF